MITSVKTKYISWISEIEQFLRYQKVNSFWDIRIWTVPEFILALKFDCGTYHYHCTFKSHSLCISIQSSVFNAGRWWNVSFESPFTSRVQVYTPVLASKRGTVKGTHNVPNGIKVGSISEAVCNPESIELSIIFMPPNCLCLRNAKGLFQNQNRKSRMGVMRWWLPNFFEKLEWYTWKWTVCYVKRGEVLNS